jgi:hypothetical protein
MVRKAVPQEIQGEVLAACRHRCAICFGLDRDTGIKPGQIAHLDRDAANPSVDNLVFLCLEHHDQFDSRTSQSKGLTSDEVRRFRQELTTAIEHAWRQPITFGSVEVPPPDGVSGRWVHGDDSDSAEIEVERMPDNRVRVHGFALHGKRRDIGPNVGELDFEGDLIAQAVMFVDERRPGHSYTLRLRFLGDSMIADEQGALGYFGVGAHLGGEYHRPTPDLTSDGATPTLAPQRLTIREKSAAEILGHLKGITAPSAFRESVEQLYLGRWTREPGWQATVHHLPTKISGGLWHCSFIEVGSGTVVFATTVQDVATLRPGDSVTLSGRIREVSRIEYVGLEDAIVRGDKVPCPQSRGLPG